MTFAVKDKASLKGFKEGDKVSAVFDRVNGQPTVVQMRPKIFARKVRLPLIAIDRPNGLDSLRAAHRRGGRAEAMLEAFALGCGWVLPVVRRHRFRARNAPELFIQPVCLLLDAKTVGCMELDFEVMCPLRRFMFSPA